MSAFSFRSKTKKERRDFDIRKRIETISEIIIRRTQNGSEVQEYCKVTENLGNHLLVPNYKSL